MTHDATYLAVYDLTDNRERERVAAVLEGYGLRVQKSVFECRLTHSARERLLAEIKSLQLHTGDLLLYELGEKICRFYVGHDREKYRDQRPSVDSEPSAMPMGSLESICWHRLHLRLRSRKVAERMGHPASIFHAVLLGARGIAKEKRSCDFFFRPRFLPWPDDIVLGETYELAVVFPVATRRQVQAFANAIPVQLSRPPHTFELETLPIVEYRNLARLEAETATSLSKSAPEIFLDFITPVEFHSAVADQPGVLDAERLARLCAVHLARLYTDLPWPLPFDATDIEITYTSLARVKRGANPLMLRSRSQGGSKRVVRGLMGSVCLRGKWQRLLPLLLPCSEVHTGYGKGDEHGLFAQRHVRNPIASFEGGFLLRTATHGE